MNILLKNKSYYYNSGNLNKFKTWIRYNLAGYFVYNAQTEVFLTSGDITRFIILYTNYTKLIYEIYENYWSSIM
jgi:hypothetical protein